jgi:hypothetical protein
MRCSNTKTCEKTDTLKSIFISQYRRKLNFCSDIVFFLDKLLIEVIMQLKNFHWRQHDNVHIEWNNLFKTNQSIYNKNIINYCQQQISKQINKPLVSHFIVIVLCIVRSIKFNEKRNTDDDDHDYTTLALEISKKKPCHIT